MIAVGEIIDALLMTFAVGYIFTGIFRMPLVRHGRIDWGVLWFACLVTAPAIIFHELAHKFAALAAGLQAVFHAAYFWLGFGILLRFFSAPFVFFVPGYVSIGCAAQPCSVLPLTMSAVAFAGPFLNLLLFLTAWLVMKYKKVKSRKWILFWIITQRINLLLFVLNMLPIPGFDGYKVYAGLWQAFF